MQSVRFARKPLSTRSYLLAMFAAVVLPLLAAATLGLLKFALEEQDRYRREAVQTARQLQIIVDSELTRLLSLLDGLAASSAFARGDLAEFYQEAKRVGAAPGLVLLLREPDGKQFFNTAVPYGAPLPSAVPLTAEERADVAAGRSIVSGVYRSAMSAEPRVAVARPLVDAAGTRILIAATIPTTVLRDLLAKAGPPGWIVAIGDRAGRYVARSELHEEVSGTAGVPGYIANITGRSGSFTSVNFLGDELLAGYARSDLSGWFVAANIPSRVVRAPLYRSLSGVAVAGLLGFGLSLTFALLISGRLGAASADLAGRAKAVGDGEPLSGAVPAPAEFAVVADALARAAETIADRERQRELLTTELNHRVKNTLAIVQALASQTFRDGQPTADARVAFEQRLAALAKAHDILTGANWEGADLGAIVERVTAALAAPARFTVAGEPVRLSPSLALSLALVLHELTTNALKHGALSRPAGRVHIAWRVEGTQLTFAWRERDGPPVTPPPARGFGSKLIERSLAGRQGFQTRLMFHAEGVECLIEAELG